jgi:hypothetical protein
MYKKRGFVKYTKSGKLIPGSLIITTSGGFPKDGVYKEVDVDLCCDLICQQGLQCIRWRYNGVETETVQASPCGGPFGCGDIDFEPGDIKCLQFVCGGDPSGPDWTNLGICQP